MAETKRIRYQAVIALNIAGRRFFTASTLKFCDTRCAFVNSYVKVGQKCGLLMGSYSRCAINTSFNTGTIVGICANVFGEGLTPKYIPDFSWGYGGTDEYAFERAIDDIARWKKMKNQELSNEEKKQLRIIFEKNNLSQI